MTFFSRFREKTADRERFLKCKKLLAVSVFRLERGPETQLQHARLVSQIAVERRLAVIGIVFVGRVGAVVRVIEQVEHFEDAEELYTLTNRDPLLEPHIHTVDRITHDAGAGDNRTVPAEAPPEGADGAPFVAYIGAEGGPATFA